MRRVLDFFPDWRRSNPSRSCCFSGLDRVGATAEPVTDLFGYLTTEAPVVHILSEETLEATVPFYRPDPPGWSASSTRATSACTPTGSRGRARVAPRVGALVAYDGSAHVRLFEDGEMAAVLSAAVRDLVQDSAGAALARASAERAARARPVETMAAAFADAVAPLWEFTEP